MRAADWVIILVVIVSAAQAAIAGFFQVAFGIAGLILGYLIAAWQYHRLADWFSTFLKSQWFSEIAAFLIIFSLVTVLASLAGRLARWAAKETGLSFLDRILGAALGLLRAGLIVAVVLMSMTAFTPTSQWLEGSQLAPYFLLIGRAAIWVAPAELRARFYQGLDLLHRAPQPAQNGTAPATGSGK